MQIHILTKNAQELETYLQSKDDGTSLYKLKKQLEVFVVFKELTPALLHRLIEKVEIKADGKAKVHYRTSTTLLIFQLIRVPVTTRSL
ncbi:DUF4368 domain-containing protein [Neobacillus soli]|uniref:DUF4368 domain-containing protein n=1 Tax=Neobacillus soli TaxID=220688 RepID=UPI00115595D2|nr:DUF4368 domain-containing protein [Neobacillus soli]